MWCVKCKQADSTRFLLKIASSRFFLLRCRHILTFDFRFIWQKWRIDYQLMVCLVTLELIDKLIFSVYSNIGWYWKIMRSLLWKCPNRMWCVLQQQQDGEEEVELLRQRRELIAQRRRENEARYVRLAGAYKCCKWLRFLSVNQVDYLIYIKCLILCKTSQCISIFSTPCHRERGF